MQMPRETIILALLAQAQSALSASFTADTQQGSAVLSNVSNLTNLAKGIPVFGPGIPDNAAIATLTPQVTLTDQATATGTTVPLTAGVRTVGRRLKFPEEVTEQPGLFVRYLSDDYPARPTGLMPKIVMDAELWLYAKSGNTPDAVPDTALNALVDAVEASLLPSPVTHVQDLGGQVVHCWIEGKIDKNPGDLDGQAMAVIPVKILAP